MSEPSLAEAGAAAEAAESAAAQQIEKWLNQAREARSLATAFQSLEARWQMLSIASAYERLARFAHDRKA